MLFNNVWYLCPYRFLYRSASMYEGAFFVKNNILYCSNARRLHKYGLIVCLNIVINNGVSINGMFLCNRILNIRFFRDCCMWFFNYSGFWNNMFFCCYFCNSCGIFNCCRRCYNLCNRGCAWRSFNRVFWTPGKFYSTLVTSVFCNSISSSNVLNSFIGMKSKIFTIYLS